MKSRPRIFKSNPDQHGVGLPWLDVDAPATALLTVTREQTLPFGSLLGRTSSGSGFRLAHRDGDVEDGRIYGERGQAQKESICVRRASGDYETWQCKKYQEITTADLKRAVTTFLEGDWAKRTKKFRLAVAPSLNATDLADETEKQRARCAAVRSPSVSGSRPLVYHTERASLSGRRLFSAVPGSKRSTDRRPRRLFPGAGSAEN